MQLALLIIQLLPAQLLPNIDVFFVPLTTQLFFSSGNPVDKAPRTLFSLLLESLNTDTLHSTCVPLPSSWPQASALLSPRRRSAPSSQISPPALVSIPILQNPHQCGRRQSSPESRGAREVASVPRRSCWSPATLNTNTRVVQVQDAEVLQKV